MTSAQDVKAKYDDWQVKKTATAAAQPALATAQTALGTAQTAEAEAQAAFLATIDEGQVVVPPLTTDHVLTKQQGILLFPPAVFLGV